MRIAWFTPYYSQSAIGTYSEAIVAALAEAGHEVTLFAPQNPEFGCVRPSRIRCQIIGPNCDPDVLTEVRQHDVAVYNMGDNFLFHGEIYEYAQAWPGIVILHDVVMRDFFWGYCLLKKQDRDLLSRMLRASHGAEAAEHGRRILAGEIPDALDDPGRLEWPLFHPALKRSLGVIVHSRYAQARLRDAGFGPVEAIDFPQFGPTAGWSRQATRPHSSATTGLRLLTYGVLNSNKLIHATIEAIGNSPLLRQAVRFDVIGAGNDGYRSQLTELIRQHGLEDIVTLHGYQEDAVLSQHLRQADIVINLRNPHMGESSASLVTSLLAGVPTIVWKHGYYAEFPEDIVCQIDTVPQIGSILERLVTQPQERLRRGKESRQYALAQFDTARYLQLFLEFTEQIEHRLAPCRLIDQSARRLREMGANSNDLCSVKVVDEIARMVSSPAASRRSPELPAASSLPIDRNSKPWFNWCHRAS